MLFDIGKTFGARTDERLHNEMTAWLTSVDRTGTPQPTPVWFLWNTGESSALLYSPPTAKRLSRIQANPRSSLHVNDDGEGHRFVVLTGSLEHALDTAPAHEHPAYVEKYGPWMEKVFGSPERFGSMFSVPLLFRASRVRGD